MATQKAVLLFSSGPPEIVVEMPGAEPSVVLDPERSLVICLAGSSREPSCEIRVCTFGPAGHDPLKLRRLHDLGWGGRRNCAIQFRSASGWMLQPMGTLPTVHLNGKPQHVDAPLNHGDRIEPARDLVFTFHIEALS